MLEAKYFLIIDDDPDDREFFREALSQVFPSALCREAIDGIAALAKLRTVSEQLPDYIFLDLNMPRKDGREALKEIRAHQELRRVPVVVFTTSRADTDIDKVYELGANSFVTKPAGFDALVATVTQLTGYWFGTVELPVLRGTSTP